MWRLLDSQIEVLLRGINPKRIKARSQAGRSFSYLEAYDVRAHLIRIFGFAQFSVETLSVETLVEEAVDEQDSKGNPKRMWSVAVRAMVKLTIHETQAIYTEAAVGGAKLPSRSEALDMATKTAVSDAMKRTAINLGDQFGLSLYDDGTTTPLVRKLIVMPEPVEKEKEKDETEAKDGPAAPGRTDGEQYTPGEPPQQADEM